MINITFWKFIIYLFSILLATMIVEYVLECREKKDRDREDKVISQAIKSGEYR